MLLPPSGKSSQQPGSLGASQNLGQASFAKANPKHPYGTKLPVLILPSSSLWTR